jgi:hypothetical protein
MKSGWRPVGPIDGFLDLLRRRITHDLSGEIAPCCPAPGLGKKFSGRSGALALGIVSSRREYLPTALSLTDLRV